MLNFSLISARLNGEISNKKPSVYSQQYKQTNPVFEQHVQTHFIDDVGLMAMEADDFQLFIQARAEAIMKVINQRIAVPVAVEPTGANQ